VQIYESDSVNADIPGLHKHNMELLPPVVAHLRDSVVPSMRGDFDSLLALRDRLLVSLVTDPRLGIRSFLFRTEVLLLVEVIDALLIESDPLDAPADLVDQVRVVDGVPIDDVDAYQFCKTHVLSPTSSRCMDTHHLMMGRILAWHAARRVRDYDTTVLSFPSSESAVSARFASILSQAAKACTFERTGDNFLSQVLTTKLYAERSALLAWRETPLRHIPKQIAGECTNKLVRPFIEVTPEMRAASIDWETSWNTDHFTFVISVLQEV
jgi:hypothetical protein